MADCEHLNVGRRDSNAPHWACKACGLQFFAEGDVEIMVEDRVDNIAAVASAMLWDFHERAVEAYGSGVADAVAPLQPGYEFTPETCPQHEYDGNSTCIHCGGSKFL